MFLDKYCNIFSWRLKFAIQKYISRRKKIRQLEIRTGKQLKHIISLVEKSLAKSIQTPIPLITGFIDLGGINNDGMLVHLSAITGKPLYVSKLARHKLIDREHDFLLWHKEYVSEMEAVSPSFVTMKEVDQSGINYLVTDYLHRPRLYDIADILSLYQKMSNLSSRVHLINNACEGDGIPVFKIADDTKIKSVISHIVTKLHTSEAFVFALDYLKQREKVFISNRAEYEKLVEAVEGLFSLANDIDFSKHYGLVHGDFKKQNILCDLNERLKLIDLQYYNYGASLWDLAFYISKEKFSFNDSYNMLVEQNPLDHTEIRIFLFLYIIAVLLHVKSSNIDKILTKKILPALEILHDGAQGKNE